LKTCPLLLARCPLLLARSDAAEPVALPDTRGPLARFQSIFPLELLSSICSMSNIIVSIDGGTLIGDGHIDWGQVFDVDCAGVR
jgi:hypothetical protein